MRVIAGSARGHRLQVPPRGTRPTSDRVREAIFSALASMCDVERSRVLDLYAGSGALGIEALSRGASSAVFVESYPSAVRSIRNNLRATHMGDSASVHPAKVESFLRDTDKQGPYDIIFADPPYMLGIPTLTKIFATLSASGRVHPQSIAVLERSRRGDAWQWPDEWSAIRDKRYGETHIYYGAAVTV